MAIDKTITDRTVDRDVLEYTVGDDPVLDLDLAVWDCMGTAAHVTMLSEMKLKRPVVTKKEAALVRKELGRIAASALEGKFRILVEDQDVHMAVERILTEKLGDLGKKIHTGRSRNDQVAVDMRMYARRQAEETRELVLQLAEMLQQKGRENHPVLMPGYTHLQRAQVVTFAYYMDAYRQMFLRDAKRLENSRELMNESPLGCGALAGTTHQLDRGQTAEALGFNKPADNFLDGVSDRDYLIELCSDFSLIMMHLSRLSEELILWSSQEFRFVTIGDG